MHRRHALATGLATVSALMIAAIGPLAPHAAAQSAGAAHSDCASAVGTFLVSMAGRGTGDSVTSRGLLSLSSDGQATLIDANQDGITGFAPYSVADGAWACVSSDGDSVEVSVLMLHFTFITGDFPTQQIGRVDVDASIDASQESLSGTLDFSLVPIDGNPLEQTDAAPALSGPITGQKIVVPARD